MGHLHSTTLNIKINTVVMFRRSPRFQISLTQISNCTTSLKFFKYTNWIGLRLEKTKTVIKLIVSRRRIFREIRNSKLYDDALVKNYKFLINMDELPMKMNTVPRFLCHIKFIRHRNGTTMIIHADCEHEITIL